MNQYQAVKHIFGTPELSKERLGQKTYRRNTVWPKMEERYWEHIIIRYANYT